MNKRLLMSAAVLAVCGHAFAGGLLTNTNLNAATLRMLSLQGVIDITGLYYNPAGGAFLNNGWHLSLNVQNAKQSRDITTTFPLFALNQGNSNPTHKFGGKADAPVIPSFQLSYNQDKWSVSAVFGITGGGGKCEFDKGLGSFEALYAGQLYQMIPGVVNSTVAGMVNAQVGQVLPGQLAAGFQQAGIPEPYATMLAGTATYNTDVKSQMTGYGLDAYMKGRQYYFGLQLGGTYKFTDKLAGFVGARIVYATCNYNGYVQDVKADYAYNYTATYNVPANEQLGFPGTSGVAATGDGTGSQDLSANGLALNADQTGWGITPIIGLDYKPNEHWNFAAKYEMKTRMRLKNKTEMNDYAKAQAETNETLGQFADGKKVAEDIPAIFTIGAQYSPVSAVRLNAGYNKYWDKQATKYGKKNELIDKGAWEITAGAEVDVCKWLTLSASWQNTNYGLTDAYMNDLSFNLSSNSIGAGFRIHATERCDIDFGYMQTFYKDKNVSVPTAAGPKSDLYERTNRVLGVGVNLAF